MNLEECYRYLRFGSKPASLDSWAEFESVTKAEEEQPLLKIVSMTVVLTLHLVEMEQPVVMVYEERYLLCQNLRRSEKSVFLVAMVIEGISGWD